MNPSSPFIIYKTQNQETIERVKPVTWRHGDLYLKDTFLAALLILLTQVYESNVYIHPSKHRWHDKANDWTNHCYCIQNTCKHFKSIQSESKYIRVIFFSSKNIWSYSLLLLLTQDAFLLPYPLKFVPSPFVNPNYSLCHCMLLGVAFSRAWSSYHRPHS